VFFISLWKYRNQIECRKKTKLTFSQDIECEIVRSNVSPFNKNILLLGVSKRKHVTGEWRKLLHNLYSSQGHVARMGEGRKVYKVLVGKPEGERPFGRPRRRREDGKEWLLGRLVGV
jgi:hypothetical protein